MILFYFVSLLLYFVEEDYFNFIMILFYWPTDIPTATSGKEFQFHYDLILLHKLSNVCVLSISISISL